MHLGEKTFKTLCGIKRMLKKLNEKYNFKTCLVVDVALNSDSEYMVKFNDGKIVKVYDSKYNKLVNDLLRSYNEYISNKINAQEFAINMKNKKS